MLKRDQISRSDFPSSKAGYDRPSVDAHLEAVAALTVALEAQVKALEVERDALRRKLGDGPPPAPDPAEPAQRDDEVSARLVATRLALEGVEREQIRERLEQTYDLDDTDSLIDDVIERLA